MGVLDEREAELADVEGERFVIVADRAPLAITRQRGEGAVLISESEWASIEETLYLLRSPRNAERLLEAVRGFEAGDQEAVPFP